MSREAQQRDILREGEAITNYPGEPDPRPYGLNDSPDTRPRFKPGEKLKCFRRSFCGCGDEERKTLCGLNAKCVPSRAFIEKNWRRLHGQPQVICAKTTGCEYDQDAECPYGVFRSYEDTDNKLCPATGEPVEWREE